MAMICRRGWLFFFTVLGLTALLVLLLPLGANGHVNLPALLPVVLFGFLRLATIGFCVSDQKPAHHSEPPFGVLASRAPPILSIL